MSFSEEFKRMNSEQRGEIFNNIARHLGEVVKTELEACTRSCLTCDRFDEPNEICNKYGGRPPARVIAFGCDGYEDKVPF